MSSQSTRSLVSPLLARCTFPPPGTHLRCAVSGGADSTALLVLAVHSGCDVEAMHVDHGLRPGSSGEADVVARSAAVLGARFVAARARVEPGANLEARAREARLAVLGPDAATGHTMDDQAETVLLNLLRGSGTDGVAAMAPGPRHPLLALRRSETRSLCEAAGLDLVEDPSNSDRRFARNRVRHELVPLCNDIARRDVVPLLARAAALAGEDARWLDELSQAIDPTDTGQLRMAPDPLARRAVRRWLTDDQGHPPDFAALVRVLSVVRGEARATELAPARRVRRSAGRLRCEPL
ncbi:MAG: tRNA lysidine(34) synthetase TilS [Acidimicrobiales bacterium]